MQDQCLGAEAHRCGLVEEWLSCYAEEEECVNSGVHHERDPDDMRKEGGQGSREFGDGILHGPPFPVGGGPIGGVARVVVHMVVSSGVGQL